LANEKTTGELDMPEDDKESMPDQYKTVFLEEFVEYSEIYKQMQPKLTQI
jgi:hypothetical protein